MVQLSQPCMTPGKTVALTIWIFANKGMSLLFSTRFRFVVAFFPRCALRYTSGSSGWCVRAWLGPSTFLSQTLAWPARAVWDWGRGPCTRRRRQGVRRTCLLNQSPSEAALCSGAQRHMHISLLPGGPAPWPSLLTVLAAGPQASSFSGNASIWGCCLPASPECSQVLSPKS